MTLKFTSVPLLFFHQDKNFQLFEKSKRIFNLSSKIKRISEGIKFYAHLYDQKTFTCAQIDLPYSIMTIQKENKKESSQIFQFKKEDYQNYFGNSKDNFFREKVTEDDYKQFFQLKMNEDYEVFINPNIIKFKGPRLSRSEFSPNYFLFETKITRFNEIEVEYFDENFEIKQTILKDQESFEFQKGFDFLKGFSPLNPSRSLGNIKPTDFCIQKLPEFSKMINEFSKELRNAVRDNEVAEIMNENSEPPTFLDQEFSKEFDLLIEKGVNEYEDLYEKEVDQK